MRILQVITSLRTGGSEKLVTQIVPSLRMRGYDVDVALFDGSETPFKKQLVQCGCKIISLSKGGSVYNPVILIQLYKLIRGYDIIHAHNTSPQFFAAICSLFNRKKYVTTEHSSSNRRRKSRFFPKDLDKWMYERYDKIICVSDETRANLESYLCEKKYSCDIITIPNGINTELFFNAKGYTKTDISPDAVRKFICVMVAGFRYEKDQDTLIRAMGLLPEESYELWLVGDGIRREELKKLSIETGVGERVLFLGIRNDIPEILHTADIVIMSSHFEGLSLSSLEGMSVGKPFVASDVDGLREVVKGAGILFPEGDAVKLAAIIRQLTEDPSYSKLISERCLERARQFDISSMVNHYSLVYEELCEQSQKETN